MPIGSFDSRSAFFLALFPDSKMYIDVVKYNERNKIFLSRRDEYFDSN